MSSTRVSVASEPRFAIRAFFAMDIVVQPEHVKARARYPRRRPEYLYLSTNTFRWPDGVDTAKLVRRMAIQNHELHHTGMVYKVERAVPSNRKVLQMAVASLRIWYRYWRQYTRKARRQGDRQSMRNRWAQRRWTQGY
ncbi:hypothetical protein M3J09_013610 [Ascochyta lentis]